MLHPTLATPAYFRFLLHGGSFQAWCWWLGGAFQVAFVRCWLPLSQPVKHTGSFSKGEKWHRWFCSGCAPTASWCFGFFCSFLKLNSILQTCNRRAGDERRTTFKPMISASALLYFSGKQTTADGRCGWFLWGLLFGARQGKNGMKLEWSTNKNIFFHFYFR